MSLVVSIVTPVYNRLSTLPETYQSILSQGNDVTWEWIVVDDGSTDGSYDWLGKESLTDSRIRLYRRNEGAKGASRCRNIGIDHAKGRFLIFLDSDDILAPNCLKERVSALTARQDLDFLVWHGELFRATPGDRKILWNWSRNEDDHLSRFLAHDVPWQTTGPLWHLTSLRRSGIRWPEGLLGWDDWGFHIEALACGLKCETLPTRDYFIRLESEHHCSTGHDMSSQTRLHLRSHAKGVAAITETLRDAKILTPDYRQLLAANLGLLAEDESANGYRWRAIQTMLKGLLSRTTCNHYDYLLSGTWHFIFARSRLASLANLSQFQRKSAAGYTIRNGTHRAAAPLSILS